MPAFVPPPELADVSHDDRRLGDAESRAAVLLRDRDAEPAAVGDRLVELVRKLVREILFHPILVVELPSQLGYRLADQLLILGQLEVHSLCHAWLLLAPHARFSFRDATALPFETKSVGGGQRLGGLDASSARRRN